MKGYPPCVKERTRKPAYKTADRGHRFEGRVVGTTLAHISDTQKCCIGIWQASRLRSRIRPGRPVEPYQGDLNCPKMRATSENTRKCHK